MGFSHIECSVKMYVLNPAYCIFSFSPLSKFTGCRPSFLRTTQESLMSLDFDYFFVDVECACNLALEGPYKWQ